MTDEQLFSILRPHVINVSGCQNIIMSGQNQNSPKGEYGSLQVRYDVSERGQANIYRRTLLDGTLETNVRPQRVMTCVVEFYRGLAKQYAENMQQMNRREDVTWDLHKHGISMRSLGPVMDLTALQSSNFEQRSRIEFVLWMEGESKYQVNPIEAVEIISELDIGVVVDDRIVPSSFKQPSITVPFINNWADHIFADARLGF